LPVQHSGSARSVAETLLAVTLSATSSIESGDWNAAGQLLRRREQLLTRLETCPDLTDVISLLQAVQLAETDLAAAMEIATREAVSDLNASKDARTARSAYLGSHSGASGLIERVG
jgi:hypothetical protein